LNGPNRFFGLVAHEEVAADRHQRDHGQMLVHGGDAGRDGVARIGEMHRLAFEQISPLGRLVHAGHGLDEGRLAGAVVAEQAVALAGIDIDRDAGQSDHRAEMLLDVLHFNDGSVFGFISSLPRDHAPDVGVEHHGEQQDDAQEHPEQRAFDIGEEQPCWTTPKISAPSAAPITEP
jgi:hypothetical protein